MKYLIDSVEVVLAVPDYVADTFTLQYLGCTEFNYFTNYITFTIKVREKNPTDR